MRSLVVGLGRAGAGLHLPVLRRARRSPARRRLFSDGPIVVCDPARDPATADPDVLTAASIGQAARLIDPDGSVAHVCTPPTGRARVLAELAGAGFRNILVEKPLATGEADLTDILRTTQRFALRMVVVAPWLSSELTRRLSRLVHGRRLGELRLVSVTQHKPRFRRSLATKGHPTAFDVELPHSLGVALLLAGDARVVAASCTDLDLGERRIDWMGCARLRLHHVGGVRTQLVSNLAAPVRERRITLQFDHGVATGHYALSEDDDHAQLTISTGDRHEHAVFPDDSLTTCLVDAYRRFLDERPDVGELALAVRVVRLLSAAKRLSGVDSRVATAEVAG